MADVVTEITSPIFDVQVGNGITGTPVVDNLTSTSTTSALSANQGRVLNVAVTANTADVSQLKSEIVYPTLAEAKEYLEIA